MYHCVFQFFLCFFPFVFPELDGEQMWLPSSFLKDAEEEAGAAEPVLREPRGLQVPLYAPKKKNLARAARSSGTLICS